MAEFDYAAAWREVAWPQYQALPQDMRDLFMVVAARTVNSGQDSDLLVLFPEQDPGLPGEFNGDIRLAMVDAPAGQLARAAHVIDCVGHWFPGMKAVAPVQGRHVCTPENLAAWDAAEMAVKFARAQKYGAHWKFSNLADQVLREKCGLPRLDREGETPPGKGRISYWIHGGFLRVCHCDRHCWEWEEVGLGEPSTLARARKILPGRLSVKRTCVERYHAALPKLKEACNPELVFPGMGQFLELFPRFDTSKESRLRWACAQVLGAPEGWKIGEIQAVNFRPHPFCVTAKHIERSVGRCLDPECAPCGFKGCRLKAAEHTHDTVLCLHAPESAKGPDGKPGLPEGGREWLKALVGVIEEHKDVHVDGFCFVG